MQVCSRVGRAVGGGGRRMHSYLQVFIKWRERVTNVTKNLMIIDHHGTILFRDVVGEMHYVLKQEYYILHLTFINGLKILYTRH